LAATSSVLAFAFAGDFSRDATTRRFAFTTDRPASYCGGALNGKAFAEVRPASKAALAVMAKRLSRLRK
jgi:hypothetical protein